MVGSNPGRAIPKALKMVPVATLLGAQYYKASTGFSFYPQFDSNFNLSIKQLFNANIKFIYLYGFVQSSAYFAVITAGGYCAPRP